VVPPARARLCISAMPPAAMTGTRPCRRFVERARRYLSAISSTRVKKQGRWPPPQILRQRPYRHSSILSPKPDRMDAAPALIILFVCTPLIMLCICGSRSVSFGVSPAGVNSRQIAYTTLCPNARACPASHLVITDALTVLPVTELHIDQAPPGRRRRKR
jgi:hypothetical protein